MAVAGVRSADNDSRRGAYCAAVIISLLNLPLTLSLDSPARAAGHTELFSGLGEWIRQCELFASRRNRPCLD